MIFISMKPTNTLRTALLLAPLAVLHAAGTQPHVKPTVALRPGQRPALYLVFHS